jgi:hypothetical protein
MHSARLSDGAFEINLEGADQQNYFIEASTDLVQWLPLQDVLAGGQLADREAGKFDQRFYRVVRIGGIPAQRIELETR